ncbi:Outer membrane cobalamin receptor protein [Filimonas lacunae]|uniref:Outer membrane cobalamin receptor protein n=1 Tax=Filimonas lacunae TaxID=477680 RepID=A0A173MIX4_9BACT|nr:TonB-dependent receptor [Filimonas lacunae]BAV07574.1 outer membrane vitamin B12 receptor protein [Filimonas lacunae]SIT29909.1 Outer membrane cobalamin receptor protein [Filimonas lacunae]
MCSVSASNTLLITFLACISTGLYGQQTYRDTTRADTGVAKNLPHVTIATTGYKEVIPSQKLAGKNLESLNSFSVADAIRYFAGVQVKDYGGIGGLKTVDMRSMGTNHMGVFYDGIQLGNAQNGQIDLGKFSMDNIESISLYNGQKSEIFQPAKDYGSSGSIYLRSRKPVFDSLRKTHVKGVFKTGSFDLINPSILFEQKLTQKINLSFSGESIYSSGRYPYRYKKVIHETRQVAWDTTAIRQNGDIHAQRLESGLYGTMNRGYWNAKAYFYNSEKGIPGAIVNNIWKRSQRQWDRNFFVQGSFQKNISKGYDVQVNAKYANDYMRYLNPDTTLLLIDNRFKQQEWYASMAHKYSVSKKVDMNLATDFQYNTLWSSMEGFVFPKRWTSLVALAGAADLGRFKMQGSVLGTFVNESTTVSGTSVGDSAAAAPAKKELSPALFVSYKLFPKTDFNIRAFYKHIFRMPTFNDLYYTDIGNSSLKPEYTHQYNLGFVYHKSLPGSALSDWQIQADCYFNQVTNKIIAVPKGGSQYRWTMINVGYAEIRGIDIVSDQVFTLPDGILFNLRASYTYQKAQDFTERKSGQLQSITYGNQLPYIPWHSGSAISSIQYRFWRLNYSFIYIGARYTGTNIPFNYVQPWYTHDLSVSKEFKWKKNRLKVAGEMNNIFNQNFDVVDNYPMPLRNYKLILSVEL